MPTYDELIALGFSPEEAAALAGTGGGTSAGTSGGGLTAADFGPNPNQLVTLPNGHTVLLNVRTGKIVQDYGAKPAGAAAPATGGQYLQNQQAQSSLAEQQRQFNEQFGYNKARFNIEQQAAQAKQNADAAQQAGLLALEQGKAQEARRQFDLQLSESVRAHNLDQQARVADQQIAGGRLGLDAYKQLTDLASSPRNYMAQFFMNRGQPLPPAAAAYGNQGEAAQQTLVPFNQFLPTFLRNLGIGGTPAGAAAGPATVSAVPPITGMSSASGAREGGNMQSDIAQTYSGQADRARTWAQQIGNDPRSGAIPGSGGAFMSGATQSGAFNPQGGTRTENPFGAENSGQQYDPAQRQQQNMDFEKQVAAQNGVKYMAGGGTLRMTAPHAIVNLLSGRVAAIAGEQPGRGPQGFVPEKAKFSGHAIIDPYKDPSTGTPTPPTTPDTSWPFGDPGGLMPSPGVYSSAPTSGYYGGTPAAPAPSTPDNAAPTTSAPSAPSTPGASAPSISAADQTRLIAESGAGAHPAEIPAAATPETQEKPLALAGIPGGVPGPVPDAIGGTPPTVLPPVVNPVAAPPPQLGYQPPGGDIGGLPPTAAPGATTPQEPMMTPLPGGGTLIVLPGQPPQVQLPDGTRVPYDQWQASQPPSQKPLPSAPLNAWGGPLYNTPSGIGNNPSFLPEDTGDPIVDQMLKSGVFPPFLQRIFAQQRGLAGLGTNVPQQTNLPPGVPLSSRLALSQMSPSELAAFQSYVSAHGIDWNDYLSMVDAASPQGGSNQNAYPKFLNQ